MALLDCTTPKDSNDILFAILGFTEHFIWILQVAVYFKGFEFCLITGRPRGAFLLVRTGSDGSAMGVVGSYEIWTHEIC
jgi:hypothetical protein